MSTSNVPRGPGLFEIARANGDRLVTNVRRVAGVERDPGAAFVTAATAALGIEAAGLLYVSFAAQYAYILRERPGQRLPSVLEALMLDTGMIIFSFLALGLAKKGKTAGVERALIIACAVGSAGMNYAAAVATSWRSVLVFVAAPAFLAVVTDRVIASVRRHVLGDAEKSAWAAFGRGLAAVAKATGLVLLYLLRLVLAPPSTAAGLRRQLLAVTPLPGSGHQVRSPAKVPAIGPPPSAEPPELAGASKKAKLAYWYRRDPAYGDRSQAARAAERVAPLAGLKDNTARAYIAEILRGPGEAGGAS